MEGGRDESRDRVPLVGVVDRSMGAGAQRLLGGLPIPCHILVPAVGIEREDEQFRRQVADAYRLLAETFPQRIEAVDGSRPPADIAKEIFGRVRESL